MKKRTLLSLLGAGLIYAGCGEEFSSSSSKSCPEEDAEVAYDIGKDASVDAPLKVDSALDALKEAYLGEAETGKADLHLDTTLEADAYHPFDSMEAGEAGVEVTAEVEVGEDGEAETDAYQIVLCPDLDQDGFFGTLAGEECYSPSGKDGDCDDGNKLIYPGALETCNGKDDGCNGSTDEEISDQSYYNGTAGTLGVGTCTGGIKSCVNETWEITTPEVTPTATDLCDGEDTNCNTFIDEGAEMSTFYFDADGDGFGDLNQSMVGCTAVDDSVYSKGIKMLNYVTKDGDCDDNNESIYPGALEQCNYIDDDCDGVEDDNVVPQEYFFDGDSDGYGGMDAEAIESCMALPAGYVTNHTDCDDQNKDINPGAPEACNTIDDDCGGLVDEGLEEIVTCGKNGNGTQKKYCENGAYTLDPVCTDPDECVKDEEKTCSGGGKLKCQLDGFGVYKYLPFESEDTGKYPNGIDDDCDKLVDEEFFVFVPAGTYEMGCDYPATCSFPGNPWHEAETDGFYLFKYEFTSTQAGEAGNLPKVKVTHSDAENYCKSLGGRLPTAEEWEIAAKGGKAENIYPGGTAPNCNSFNYWYCIGDAVAVGSYSNDKSTWEEGDIYDMGGNVSEWTSTPEGLSAIVKGGNWKDEPNKVAVYYQESVPVTTTSDTLGFRCLRDKK